MSTLVIVGAGLAGAKAAEGARDAGYEGRIVLLGEEAHPPYERPPLSKQVLRGEKPPESAHVHDGDYWENNNIEVVRSHVKSVDLSTRTVDGELEFDELVLATGARPRVLDIPGSDLDGIYYLRTIDQSLELGEAIRAASRVAVIGAGWIGSEVAASARQLGADVVMIDPFAAPLLGVLGPVVAPAFTALHADQGVTLRLGVGVSALQGAGSVDSVLLADGSVEAADVVVIGVGAVPNIELAEAAGLATGNGVEVDEQLRTAVPGVFATGDVASAYHPFFKRNIRIEHWANALNQGKHAGRNAAGEKEPYDRLPYFYSDQYDLGLEYVGLSGKDDAVTVRGSLESREFLAFYHRDGLLTAALAVNTWDVIEDLKAMITTRWPVDEAVLTDPGVALTDLRGSVP